MTPDELTAIEERLPYLDKDTIPRLIDALRAERAENERLRRPAEAWNTLHDFVTTHCDTDNLPAKDDADRDINAWLRMRAQRDEALSDLAKLRAERDELNHLKIAMHEIEQMTWGGKGESAVHVVAANALNEIIKSQRQRRIATGES